jgi:endoglucanase
MRYSITRFFRLFLIIFTLFLSGNHLMAQGFLHANGKYIHDGNGEPVILRGIGTGNWLLNEGYMMKSADVAGTHTGYRNKLIETIGETRTNTFYDTWLNNHFSRRDVDSMKVWGFNSVRVAMHYKWLTLPIEDEPVAGQDTWFEAGFVRLDSLLDWCGDNQMYLILDLHGAPGGQGKDANISDYDPTKPSLWESAENRRKTVALWRKLAERYANEPWIGGYDLLNEPNWVLPNGTLLKQLYLSITNAIREVDQNHMIIIEGNWFANDYTGLTPPWDDNLVYSFHKYWTFNTPGSINWMINLRNTYNIPIWLGETGENSNSWFTSLIEICEDLDIGWAWWPVKKAGINNVLRVPESQIYNNLIEYWKTGSPAMTSDQAFAAVMEWADNHRIQNCIVQRDVIDAMIRQPHTDETLPFKTHRAGNLIHAVDYDLGKCSFAYFDNDTANYHLSTNSFTAWNAGWQYRNDGVDIENCTDASPTNIGYNVSHIEDDEWLQYTMISDSAAAYTVTFRSAANALPAIVRLEINGLAASAAHTLPITGGWQTWANSSINNVILPAGTNKVKVYFERGGSNFTSLIFSNPTATETVPFQALFAETNSQGTQIYLTLNRNITGFNALPTDFQVKANGIDQTISQVVQHAGNARIVVVTVSNPILVNQNINISYTGNSIETDGMPLIAFTNLVVKNKIPNRFIIPGKIQAEDFYFNNGFQLEDCTDVGGGKNVAFANNGDYLDYLISIGEGGEHTFSFRVASQYSNGKIAIQLVNGPNISNLNTISFTQTGGWQSWNNQNIVVNLPVGDYKLRLLSVDGEYNLNWFEITKPTGVADSRLQESVVVFPNPSRGSFNLQANLDAFSDVMIEIADTSGRLVFSKQVSNTLVLNENIRLDFLKSGIYFLSLSTEKGKAVVKLSID